MRDAMVNFGDELASPDPFEAANIDRPGWAALG